MAINSSYTAGQEVHFYEMESDHPSRIDFRITRVKDNSIMGIVLENTANEDPEEPQPGDDFYIDVTDPEITDDEDELTEGHFSKGLVENRIESYDSELESV